MKQEHLTANALKPITVGPVSIFPNIYLSPMHGVTDYAFRSLIQKITNGKIGLFTSEFISAKELCFNSPKSRLQMKFDTTQQPFCAQIYGGDSTLMIKAAKIAEKAGANIIEINSGCPSPRVVQRQCGSGLLLDLNHFKQIVQSVVSHVSLPVSVKVRLGYTDDNINVLESHHIAEEEGVKMFVIHGRTRQQGYKGLADWDKIGEVKSRSKIPIVGNGDILTFKQALEKLKIYGVDGISIGRGMIHNPWLLREVSNFTQGILNNTTTIKDQLTLFKTYSTLLLKESNSEIFTLGRLKQMGCRILKTYNPNITSIQTVLKTKTLEHFFLAVSTFFENDYTLQLDKVENLNSYHHQKIEFESQY